MESTGGWWGPSVWAGKEHLQPQACQVDGEGFKLQVSGGGNFCPFLSNQFDVSVSRRYQSLEWDHRPEGEHLKIHRGIPDTPGSKLASLETKFECLCANTQNMGNEQKSEECVPACRAIILLASLRCERYASMNGELEWFRELDTGSSGRTGTQEHEMTGLEITASS